MTLQSQFPVLTLVNATNKIQRFRYINGDVIELLPGQVGAIPTEALVELPSPHTLTFIGLSKRLKLILLALLGLIPGTTPIPDPDPDPDPDPEPLPALQITSSTGFAVQEGVGFTASLTTNRATPITFQKLTGRDSAQFTLTGNVLTLPAKAFNTPADSDLNNTYLVDVRATDPIDGSTDTETITVTVTQQAVTLKALSLLSPNAFFGTPWSSVIQNRAAGSTITVTSSDGAPFAVNGDVVSGTFPSPVVQPSLRALSLGNDVARFDTLWTSSVQGRTPGSTLTVVADDGTVLTINGDNVSGTFAAPVVVPPTPTLRPLSLDAPNAKFDIPWLSLIKDRTAGSTITVSSSDSTALTITGDTISGTFVNPAPVLKTLGLQTPTAKFDTSWLSAILNKTPGSTITATADDGTVLTITGDTVTGLFVTPTALKPLQLASPNAVLGAAWSSAILNKTPGSTITVAVDDGTPMTISGSNISGTFPAPVLKTLGLTPLSATRGVQWTGTLSNRTPGSTINADVNDGTPVNVTGNTLTATFN